MKSGVIDVGGGYRGIYAAGVFDYCLDHKLFFDLGIGVSAGSANLISYAALQPRRNLKFYTEYGVRKEYAGLGNFFKKKTFIDLDYAYSELSNSDGEYPLDYPAFAENPMEFYVVATEAESGKATYFDKSGITQDHYEALKASCALPVVCHPYEVNGTEYFDGALSDPVPVRKAFELGCDKAVLILTKPENFVRSLHEDDQIVHLLRHSYPEAAASLHLRAKRYNDGVALAQQLAKQGKVLIVAPDDTCGVTTLTRDPALLRKLYRKGYSDGSRIRTFLSSGKESR